MTRRKTSRKGAFRTLWHRSPLWRFTLMCAILCSLVIVASLLTRKIAPKLSSLDEATYQPIKDISTPQTPPPATQKPIANTQTTTAPTLELQTNTPVTTNISGVNPALMGRTISDSILVGGYKLPLPPGQWVILSGINLNPPNFSGAAYFLGKIESKKLVAAIRAFALHSKEAPGVGFPEQRFCKRSDLLYLTVDALEANGQQSCWGIYNHFTSGMLKWGDKTANIDNLDRAAAGDLSAKGVDYPQDFVGVEFVRAEKWGILQTSYLFSPESDGIKSNNAPTYQESDWYPKNIGHYPEKQTYVKKLVAWGADFWSKYQAAFNTAPLPQ